MPLEILEYLEHLEHLEYLKMPILENQKTKIL